MYVRTRRRLRVFCDQPPAVGFSLSRHTSSLRGCCTTLDRDGSSCLVCSTAHRLISMAASKSRLMNSLRAVPLAEFTSARIPRMRALCATTDSASFCGANPFSGLSPYFFLAFRSNSLSGRRDGDFSVVVFRVAGDDGLPGSPTYISMAFPRIF